MAGDRDERGRMDDYNYSYFDMDREEPPFLAFPNRLHVGERAPSFELEDLDTGEMTPMSSLWRNGPAILEFGSFT
jgi:deoxycytidine triphosphate deaminase